jgi:hypothetical protein
LKPIECAFYKVFDNLPCAGGAMLGVIGDGVFGTVIGALSFTPLSLSSPLQQAGEQVRRRNSNINYVSHRTLHVKRFLWVL